MVELYTGTPDDVDYAADQLEISEPFTAYIQQIRNILIPEEGTIMGASDMPLNLEKYIYERNFSGRRLEKMIYDSILNYCPFSEIFRTSISLKFGKGTERDIVLIDILIEDSSGKEKKFGFLVK